MRTRGFLAALVAPLLLVSGCGEQTADSASDPSPAATSPASPSAPASDSPSAEPVPDGPACATVWRDGATLPRSYSGCVAGSEEVRPSDRYCEFGKKLVVYGDRFYAVRTGTIHRTDGPLDQDRGYRSAMASCLG